LDLAPQLLELLNLSSFASSVIAAFGVWSEENCALVNWRLHRVSESGIQHDDIKIC
jgi:hypothetical protein